MKNKRISERGRGMKYIIRKEEKEEEKNKLRDGNEEEEDNQ